MFKIIGFLVVGVILGIAVRGRVNAKYITLLITSIIYTLLLVLGITVGANENVINNLGSLGLNAFIISISSVIGSCCFALLIYKKIFIKKEEVKNEK